MKLLGIVITYFPDKEITTLNIEQYIQFVDKLIIWNNTPSESLNDYLINLPKYENKILQFSTGRNEGIAYPLNQAIKWGVENGYSHLLTMDQDSFFEHFKNYKEVIEDCLESKEIGIFSPIIKSPLNPNVEYEKSSKYELIEESITSGSIYVLSIFDKIGLFREDYFIDAIDTEICYRAKKYGFSTVLIKSGRLMQEFGRFTKSKIGFTATNYSSFRTFFIVRNNIWLCKEYPDDSSKRDFISYLIKRIVKIIFHEDDKCAKLRAITKGIFNGIKGS